MPRRRALAIFVEQALLKPDGNGYSGVRAFLNFFLFP